MCGRFASKETKEKLAELYKAKAVTFAPFKQSYNVAPMESAPIVLEGEGQQRAIELGTFGITMQKAGKPFVMMNAQAESYAKWQHILTKRCIIPASGFYEWLKVSEKDKQPYFFSPKEDLFSFAGYGGRRLQAMHLLL